MLTRERRSVHHLAHLRTRVSFKLALRAGRTHAAVHQRKHRRTHDHILHGQIVALRQVLRFLELRQQPVQFAQLLFLALRNKGFQLHFIGGIDHIGLGGVFLRHQLHASDVRQRNLHNFFVCHTSSQRSETAFTSAAAYRLKKVLRTRADLV